MHMEEKIERADASDIEGRAPMDENTHRAVSVGEGVVPSTGAFSTDLADTDPKPIPNYREIRSADYPDSGFSLRGFISEKDARLLAASRDLLDALTEILQIVRGLKYAAGLRGNLLLHIEEAAGKADSAIAKAREA